MKVELEITYDEEVDAAYIYLCDLDKAPNLRTVTTEDGNLNIDIDKDTGVIVGIEILGSAFRLPPEIAALFQEKKNKSHENL